MIIVKYTLTKEGKIPSYIIDGGYLAIKNNKKAPQDYDLIGISSGNTGLHKFLTKDELKKYVDTLTFPAVIIPDDIPTQKTKLTNLIWDKIA